MSPSWSATPPTRRSAGASSSPRRRWARCATPTRRRTFGSPTRSPAGRLSTSATAAGCCGPAVTPSRPSRGSCCCRSCRSAPATWGALGFDAMDEAESLAACEALFAEELRGHRLLSNRSLWTDFMLVRNESWHHGDVVLLGDAAHTAHFSIGSGTKLAMEDAIALAQAF